MTENQENDLEIDNLPNRLTIFRILLIPIVIALLHLADPRNSYLIQWKSALGWTAAWIFMLASATDFFDGYIARKRNIVTVFGSFLDPIADKFLVVSSLIMLQSLGRIPVVVVIFLVLRELYMTSLRLLAKNEGISVPVNNLGKWKTGFQMAAITMLMANEPWLIFPWPQLGIICIYISFALSLISAITYSTLLIRKMKQKRAERKKIKKQQKQEKKVMSTP